jgi:hypothetical protein
MLRRLTVCYQFTSLFSQAAFEDLPILSGRLIIRLLGEDLDDVHDRKPPRFGLFIVEAADFVSLKNGQILFIMSVESIESKCGHHISKVLSSGRILPVSRWTAAEATRNDFG